MVWILGLLVLVLDIIAIADALKNSMGPGEKTLWIILIIFLPVIGMAAYFLMSRKK